MNKKMNVVMGGRVEMQGGATVEWQLTMISHK